MEFEIGTWTEYERAEAEVNSYLYSMMESAHDEGRPLRVLVRITEYSS